MVYDQKTSSFFSFGQTGMHGPTQAVIAVHKYWRQVTASQKSSLKSTLLIIQNKWKLLPLLAILWDSDLLGAKSFWLCKNKVNTNSKR